MSYNVYEYSLQQKMDVDVMRANREGIWIRRKLYDVLFLLDMRSGTNSWVARLYTYAGGWNVVKKDQGQSIGCPSILLMTRACSAV